MLSERHELNKIALLELKKDVEETREFSSYLWRKSLSVKLSLKWQIFYYM